MRVAFHIVASLRIRTRSTDRSCSKSSIASSAPLRRRPGEARVGFLCGFALELLMVGIFR